MKKIWNKAPDTPLFYDLPTKGKAQRQSAGDVLQELDRRKLKARKRLYVAVWIVCILGLKVGIDMYGTNQERHKNEVTGIEEVKASASEAEPMSYMLGDTEIVYNGVNWEQVETGSSTGLNLQARRVIKGDSAEVSITTDIMQGIPIGTSLDTIKRSKKGYIEQGTNGEWVTEQLDDVLGVYTLTLVYRVYEVDKNQVSTGRCTQTTEVYIGSINSQEIYTLRNVVYTAKDNLDGYNEAYGEDIRGLIKQVENRMKAGGTE